MGPIIKISDGQGLHVFEHVVPYLFEGTLLNGYQDSGVGQGGGDPDGIDDGHEANDLQEAAKIRIVHTDHGHDIIVN